MEQVIEKIRDLIQEPMTKMEISIEKIEWIRENKNNFLKIELDKLNGLDLDTVVEATNVINPILDKADLIEDEYILDISSKERG